jgi:hypothetical protein
MLRHQGRISPDTKQPQSVALEVVGSDPLSRGMANLTLFLPIIGHTPLVQDKFESTFGRLPLAQQRRDAPSYVAHRQASSEDTHDRCLFRTPLPFPLPYANRVPEKFR